MTSGAPPARSRYPRNAAAAIKRQPGRLSSFYRLLCSLHIYLFVPNRVLLILYTIYEAFGTRYKQLDWQDSKDDSASSARSWQAALCTQAFNTRFISPA